MLKKLFFNKTSTIASAAIIVGSFSVLSRVVGFIRDRILAGAFGASDTLDIYFAAFRIPDLLFQMVIVGALSASFIPLFTRYYSKGKKDTAWEFTNNVLNATLLVFGAVILLAFFSANPLAALVAPGFDDAKQLLVADLSQVMFLAQFLLAASMVYGSVLQGTKRFLLYSSAPILYNFGIIAGILFFEPIFGIIGLAWGVVFGALLHALIQLIGVWSLGYRFRFFIQMNEDLRYMFKHALPRIAGLTVNQVNFIGMTMIATLLTAGSVTILQFAYTLNFFPVGVIAVSYAIVAFPTLCEQSGKMKAFVKTFSTAIRQMMLFIIPATVLFLLLRAQIVRVVFGAGQFDWIATIITADTLAFFIISLFAQSAVFLLIRAFFALDNTIFPFIVGIVTAAINLSLGYILSQTYGVIGLSISYSVASIVQMALLWVILRTKTGTLDELYILNSLAKLSLAGLLSAFAVQATKNIVVRYIELTTFLNVLAQLVIASSIGLAVYGIVAILLKSEEMEQFLNGMRRKLLKKAKAEETVLTDLS